MKTWISTVAITAVAVVVGLPGQMTAAQRGATLRKPAVASAASAAHEATAMMAALPSEQWPSQRFTADRLEANQRAATARRALEQVHADASLPCTDAIEPAHDREADGGVTLRPGQELVLRGCFGDAPGQALLRGVAGEELPLTLLAWAPNMVHLRLPDFTGVPDRDTAWLRLRRADGVDLGMWPTRFRARRALHALVGDDIQAHLATPLQTRALQMPPHCARPVLRTAATGAAIVTCADEASADGEPVLAVWPRGAQQRVVGLVWSPPPAGLVAASRPLQGLWIDAPVGVDRSLGLPSARLMAQAQIRPGAMQEPARAVASAMP